MALRMQALDDFDFLTFLFIMKRKRQWEGRSAYVPEDLARLSMSLRSGR